MTSLKIKPLSDDLVKAEESFKIVPLSNDLVTRESEEEQETSAVEKTTKLGKKLAGEAAAGVGDVARGIGAQAKQITDMFPFLDFAAFKVQKDKLEKEQGRQLTPQEDLDLLESVQTKAKEITEYVPRKTEAAAEKIEEAVPRVDEKIFKGPVLGTIEEAATGVTRFAAPMGMSAISGPAGFYATYVALKGNKYKQLKDNGVDENTAQEASDIHALTSTPAEFLGNILQIKAAKSIFGAVGKRLGIGGKVQKIISGLLKGGAGEGIEEWAQAHTEVIADVYADDPKATSEEMAEKIQDVWANPEFQKSAVKAGGIGAVGGTLIPGAATMLSAPFDVKSYLAERKAKKQNEAIGLKQQTQKEKADLFEGFREEAVEEKPEPEMPGKLEVSSVRSGAFSSSMTADQVAELGAEKEARAKKNAEIRANVEAARAKKEQQAAQEQQQAAAEEQQAIQAQKKAETQAAEQEQRRFNKAMSFPETAMEETSAVLNTYEKTEHDKLVKPVREMHKALSVGVSSSDKLRSLQYELKEKYKELFSFDSKLGAISDKLLQISNETLASMQQEETRKELEKASKKEPKTKQPKAAPKEKLVDSEVIKKDIAASQVTGETRINDTTFGELEKKIMKGEPGVLKELEHIYKEKGRNVFQDWMNPAKMGARLKRRFTASGIDPADMRAEIRAAVNEYELKYNEVLKRMPKKEKKQQQQSATYPQPKKKTKKTATKGLSKKEANKAVEKAKLKLGNRVKIEVLESSEKLKTKNPKQYANMKKDKARGSTVAAFDPATRTAYIFADMHSDPNSIHTALWHELGHFSLGDLLGKDLDPLLDRVRSKYNNKILDRIKAYGYKNTAANRKREAEEILIKKFEDGSDVTIRKRLMDLLRKFAQKLGIAKDAITDTEIADLVKAMKKNLAKETKVKSKAEPDMKARYSRAYDAARKYIGVKEDDKVNKNLLGLSWWDKFVTHITDTYKPLKKLEAQDTEAKFSGYIAHNLMSNFSAIMNSIVHEGRPIYQDHWIKVTPEKEGGIYDVWKSLGNNAEHFFNRLTAKSAQEMLNKGRKHLFGRNKKGEYLDDQAMIDALLEGTDQLYQENKEAWDWAENRLRDINKSILDFAEKANVIGKEQRKEWEREYYIPFYRVLDDNWLKEDIETLFPKGGGRLIGTVHQLRGSSMTIGDPLMNLISSYSFLMNESLKNLARTKTMNFAQAAEAIVKVPGTQKKKQDVISIRVDGKPQYYKVLDKYLYDALIEMETATGGRISKIIDKIFGMPKRWKTITVTLAPIFRFRNFLRDTLHTAFMDKESRGLLFGITDAMKGFYHSFKKTDEFKEFASTGAAFTGSYHQRDITADTAKGIEKLKKQLKRKEYQLKSPADWFRFSWDLWERIGEASENANRFRVYKAGKKTGKSDLQAAYDAMDLLNFHRTGKNSVLQLFTRTIPFLNARIQGLYKVGRSATDPKTRLNFWLHSMALVTASTLLHVINADDDRYKELPDHEKLMYWHIFDVPGLGHVRIPKPFEAGVFFASIPEALAEFATKDKSGKDLYTFIRKAFGDIFEFDPRNIATFGPLLTQYANKDPFTGAQVVPEGEKGIAPELQVGSRTSKTAQTLGKATKISPRRIDKVLNDYFTWAAALSLEITDTMLDWAMEFPEDPAVRLGDRYITGIGGLARGKDWTPSYTKYTEKYYDFKAGIDEAYASFNHLKRGKQREDAKAWRAKHKPKLKLKKRINNWQKKISKINTRINLVRTSKGKYTPEEKRKEIDELLQKRSELWKEAVQRIEASLKKKE